MPFALCQSCNRRTLTHKGTCAWCGVDREIPPVLTGPGGEPSEVPPLASEGNTAVHCKACGRENTWLTLELVGIQSADELSGQPALELRQCPCGSTLSQEVIGVALTDDVTAAWEELDTLLETMASELRAQGPDLTRGRLEQFAAAADEARETARQLRIATHPTTATPPMVGAGREQPLVGGEAPGDSTPPGVNTALEQIRDLHAEWQSAKQYEDPTDFDALIEIGEILAAHPTTGPVTVGQNLARDMAGVVGETPALNPPPGAGVNTGRLDEAKARWKERAIHEAALVDRMMAATTAPVDAVIRAMEAPHTQELAADVALLIEKNLILQAQADDAAKLYALAAAHRGEAVEELRALEELTGKRVCLRCHGTCETQGYAGKSLYPHDPADLVTVKCPDCDGQGTVRP